MLVYQRVTCSGPVKQKKTFQKKTVPNPHLGRTVWIGGPQRISLLLAGGESQNKPHCITHWIGLRENLQETMVFTIKYRAFLYIFPSCNSMNYNLCLPFGDNLYYKGLKIGVYRLDFIVASIFMSLSGSIYVNFQSYACI